MKARRAVMIALLVGLAILAGAVWLGRKPKSQQVLATDFVEAGPMAVRVDRFEVTHRLPGRLRKMPPSWMLRYPALINAWSWLYRENERVDDGLVWVLVEATVASNQPLQSEQVTYRLDYGPYTLGSSRTSFKTEPGRPYQIGTRFEVTDGPVPKALEIQVAGEWFRFPIEER